MARVTERPEKVLKTLLSDNWTADNTDSITPTIDLFSNQPDRVDVQFGDFIFLAEVNGRFTPAGIGTTPLDENFIVHADIRIGGKDLTTIDSHFTKVVNEFKRIVDAKIITVGNGYSYMEIEDETMFNDRSRYMLRCVLNIRMVSINSTR